MDLLPEVIAEGVAPHEPVQVLLCFLEEYRDTRGVDSGVFGAEKPEFGPPFGPNGRNFSISALFLPRVIPSPISGYTPQISKFAKMGLESPFLCRFRGFLTP